MAVLCGQRLMWTPPVQKLPAGQRAQVPPPSSPKKPARHTQLAMPFARGSDELCVGHISGSPEPAQKNPAEHGLHTNPVASVALYPGRHSHDVDPGGALLCAEQR